MPTFKFQGQVYHLAGSLLPYRPDDRTFLLIYFIADHEIQAAIRCNKNSINTRASLDSSIVRSLHLHNIYVQSIKTAMESDPPYVPDYNVIHANKIPTCEHRERYNVPLTSYVAVVIAVQQFDKWDIVLRSRDLNLHKI